jgi:hypothetical protein
MFFGLIGGKKDDKPKKFSVRLHTRMASDMPAALDRTFFVDNLSAVLDELPRGFSLLNNEKVEKIVITELKGK